MGGRQRRPGHTKIIHDYAACRTAMYEVAPGGYVSSGTFVTHDEARAAWIERAAQIRRRVHTDPRRGRAKFPVFTGV